MIFSPFHRNNLQSTKWGRVRVNYDLVEAIILAKEYFEPSETKRVLNIQSTVMPNENKQINRRRVLGLQSFQYYIY